MWSFERIWSNTPQKTARIHEQKGMRRDNDFVNRSTKHTHTYTYTLHIGKTHQEATLFHKFLTLIVWVQRGFVCLQAYVRRVNG